MNLQPSPYPENYPPTPERIIFDCGKCDACKKKKMRNRIIIGLIISPVLLFSAYGWTKAMAPKTAEEIRIEESLQRAQRARDARIERLSDALQKAIDEDDEANGRHEDYPDQEEDAG